MSRHAEWLEFLEKNEQTFNEELHLLGSGEKQVEFLPVHSHQTQSGWILTYSDTDAGEWNLARAFGRPEIYQPLLKDFPGGIEFQLLVPENESALFMNFSGLKKKETLIWHQDSGVPKKGDSLEFSSFLEIAGYECKFLLENALDPFLFNLKGYLLKNNSIVSLIKTIHVSLKSIEVYIETFAGCRNMGLGFQLLREFVRLARRHHKQTVYVTSEDNVPSRHIAEKVGFQPYQSFTRMSFVRGSQ